MSYGDFQRAHPHWPRTMKELIGHKVRLTEKVVTCGGQTYEAGEVFKVYGVYRGRIHLDSLDRKDAYGNPRGVRFASPKGLELCE